ncbi:hypothetical protein B0187_09735 [Haemophilus paracuniculus]|uniref:Uncharacterized protein n=1 Tax=Haemophilus paracuniculus TaxID=734 RepID=A0A1T0AQ71_9PAST|nr:hypothetical protein [Haemophilus paracuniculus]OOR98071.1 hypothetical protein B0187_09735 [Haemophilus paracuniculus]
MNWLDWLKIGGVVVVLLAILGWYLERKQKRQEELEEAERKRQEELEEAERKRQEEMKEEDNFVDALLKNICPQCGTKESLKKLEDESSSTPYALEGMMTIKDRKQDCERRMQVWTRFSERAIGCTQCDYHKVYYDTLTYNVKKIADYHFECPQCGEEDVYLKDIKATDRYQANKEVIETTARGTKSRYIKVTKVVEEETYACKNCDFTSVATVTTELN